MSNILYNILTALIFLIKVYLLNMIKELLFKLINKMESIIKKSPLYTENSDKIGEQLLNIVFIFGMIYGNICNYVNKVKLI